MVVIVAATNIIKDSSSFLLFLFLYSMVHFEFSCNNSFHYAIYSLNWEINKNIKEKIVNFHILVKASKKESL